MKEIQFTPGLFDITRNGFLLFNPDLEELTSLLFMLKVKKALLPDSPEGELDIRFGSDKIRSIVESANETGEFPNGERDFEVQTKEVPFLGQTIQFLATTEEAIELSSSQARAKVNLDDKGRSKHGKN